MELGGRRVRKHLWPLTAQTVGATLDEAGVISGCRVLDVCTGHGVLAGAASERGAKVSAIDFADAMVAVARRNAPKVDCSQRDAQNLPYPENAFDAVVCGYGLMHMPEPDRALAEMRRVLRPKGRLAISVWERPAATNGFGILFDAIRTHGRLDVPLPHGPDFFQFGDPENMRAALVQNGFADIRTAQLTWRFDSGTGLVDAILQGAVRAKALLVGQTEDALSSIRTAVEQGMERLFRTDDAFLVSIPFS